MATPEHRRQNVMPNIAGMLRGIDIAGRLPALASGPQRLQTRRFASGFSTWPISTKA
jgi:hypothetical protein